MKKVTKKKQIEDLQTVVAAQWRQINKLKLHLGRLVDIDWTDEQANHDAVIAILDSKEPKLKVLDQSVFDDEPPHLKWAAVEEDGGVYLFALKPFIDLRKWGAGTDEIEVFIDHGYDATDWQNSLIERDDIAKELLEVDLSSELTGSELCLKLLNLDRDVMCDVKDGDYRLIFAHDGEFFISHNKGERECHERVTPINNQGEPLTAADVGL